MISVIMPCYNGERYLSAALDSVLAQSFVDWELVVVDDGSTDESLAIAMRYADKDERIRVLHQENGGVCAARNLALDAVRGEWITFVDCDDLLLEDALDTMISAVSDEVDMVVCAHETFDDAGHTGVVIPETCWPKLHGETRRRAIALRLIEGDSVLNIMCNKLHRRALIEREGLRLVRGVKIAEDALFNLEAVLCGRGVAYVNRVTYRYRTHNASTMHTHHAGELTRHAPWLRAMAKMLQRRSVLETYYSAYANSVVLRLYKDGGVAGVMCRFKEQALPLIAEIDLKLDMSRMTFSAKLLRSCIRSGGYPAVYPIIWLVQTTKRKLSAAAFALRAQKEKPI